jgi:hypothetical protein
MHKLTNDRILWGIGALLAATLIGLTAACHDGVLPPKHAEVAQALVLQGTMWSIVTGIVLVLMLRCLLEQPERKAAIRLSVGIACSPFLQPVMLLYFGAGWFIMLVVVALWLLVLLARMRQWRALLVALLGSVWALLTLVGWLGMPIEVL